jgi:surfactin synthase thioesterase subunit
MGTIFAVEEAYPRVQLAMLDVAFPGRLSPKEKERWNELRQLADALYDPLRENTGRPTTHISAIGTAKMMVES